VCGVWGTLVGLYTQDSLLVGSNDHLSYRLLEKKVNQFHIILVYIIDTYCRDRYYLNKHHATCIIDPK
jgi:hypothetical protein